MKTPKHITEGIEQLRRALEGVGGNEVSLTAVNRFSDGWKCRSYISSGGEHIFRHMHKNDIPRNWIDFFQAVQPEVLTWLVENQKTTGVERDG